MKKIISSVLALLLAVQTAGAVAFAAAGDSVTIKGGTRLRTRSILRAIVTSQDTDFSYQWMWSDKEDGNYLPINGATESEYVLSTMDAEKFIGLTVTNKKSGEVLVSDVKRKLDTLGPISKTNFTQTEAEKAKNTPAENLFYAGGQGFVLLNEYDDENSKYYVMADETYGEKVFDADGFAKFDVTKENNIGYFLNNEFLTSGNNGKKLPDEIISHIDKNHVWWTESGMKGGDSEQDYSFTAGVSLLSGSEADYFYGKYGWNPSDDGGNWWLRTQRGAPPRDLQENNIFSMMGSNEAEMGNISEVLCTNSNMIRPVFYLDKNFFSKVKIDSLKTGANITKILKNNYTQDELKAIYSDNELMNMGILEKEFELKMLTETDQNGTKLVAEVTNLKNIDLKEIKYQWVYKTEESKEYKPIYKANDKNYIVSTEDAGRTISVTATPVAGDGTEKNKLTTEKNYVVRSFGQQNRTKFDAAYKAKYKNPAKENIFSVNGMEFILLNEFENENSAFYVITRDHFGKKVYDPDGNEKFDVNDKNNIAHFLNNEFITEGNNKKVLPKAITDHIDYNHVWYTEAGDTKNNCPDDYSFEAGISFISKSEFYKYYEKIGYEIGTYWWTRTARGINGLPNNILCAITLDPGTSGDLWDKDTTTDIAAIRPVFYLNRSFFKDVKVENPGANVIKALKDTYSIKELTEGGAGYTKEELDSLGVIVAPEIKNIEIAGNGAVNAKINGEYIYSGEKAEGESEKGFEVSSDNVNYTVKASGSDVYEISEDDMNKYVRFYAVPKTIEGIPGKKVYSKPIKITRVQDIAVNDFVFDESVKITDINEIRPEFTLSNKTGEAKTAVLIMAAYDNNDHIVKSGINEISLGSNENVKVSDLSLSLSGIRAKYAKIFILDSLSNANSLLGYEVVIK